MRFLHVRLRAGADRMTDMRAFYERTLELPVRAATEDLDFTTAIGETELAFAAAPGEPFHHFALLVPGDRFGAALAWASERVTLLPHSTSSEVVFDFPAWNAQACYFHDPAGNIVELIAHRDREATGASGGFAGTELLGLSELGLVGQPTAMAPALEQRLDLTVWDGQVADRNALAFVGEPARTLILVPTGRGWLPTGRPAQRHPLEAVLSAERSGDDVLSAERPEEGALSGERPAAVELEDGLYRLSRRP
jgi:catechol 2,3-dioxygenase-like lactoylglutathione lyase family enzyme